MDNVTRRTRNMVAKEALLGRLLAVLHRTPSPPSFFLPSFVEEADMSIVANNVNNPKDR